MSSLWEQIESVAESQPNKIAIEDGSVKKNFSYGELIPLVNDLATQLQLLDRGTVALYGDNSASWILADLAIQKAGYVAVPIPTFFSEAQRNHALQDAGVRYVISENPDLFTGSGFKAQGQLSEELTLMVSDQSRAELALPANTQKITYTSGSTGNPKGVCLSAEHIARVAKSISSVVEVIGIDRHLSILPFSTLLENIAGIYSALLQGATIVVYSQETLGFKGSSEVSIEKFLAGVSISNPGSMILIPQQLEILTHAAKSGWRAPATLRFIAIGGSKVSQQLIEQASNLGLPVFEGYGLSECGSVVSLNTPANNKPGSVGKPLPHASVSTSGGEIIVEGKQFLGYTHDHSAAKSENFATGDLGEIDDEGFLHVKGRKKNILISSFGRNISPEWIECELGALSEIRQCVVFGDARPFCVALIYNPGDVESSNIDLAINELNKTLPDYAQIKSWHRLDRPLSTQEGFLTVNGRPRREQIFQSYQSQIDSLYLNPEQKPSPLKPLNKQGVLS